MNKKGVITYMSIAQFHRLLRTDYGFMRRTLHSLGTDSKIKVVDGKYSIKDFLNLYLTNPGTPESVLKEGVLTIHEAHKEICEFLGKEIHFKTVARKVKKKEITALHIGTIYRIPRTTLRAELGAWKERLDSVPPKSRRERIRWLEQKYGKDFVSHFLYLNDREVKKEFNRLYFGLKTKKQTTGLNTNQE